MRYAVKIVLWFLLVVASAASQWATDPSNNLIVGYGLLPELCSDSAGGAYVTYENSTVYPRQIELRRLNAYGYQPWVGSRLIQGIWPETRYAALTSDGHNGVIIAYLDRLRYPPPYFILYHQRVRVQRVDSAGNLLWGPMGVRVSLTEHTQSADQAPAIVSDNSGGCIVAWKDTLDIIRMQRINNFGVRVFGDSGIAVLGNTQYVPGLARTSSSSVVLAFGALLKKYDLEGNPMWGGQMVNVGFGTRGLLGDGFGNIIVYDGTGSSSNVLMVTQKFDSSGFPVWTMPYIVLGDSTVFSALGYPLCIDADGTTSYSWNRQVGPRQEVFTQRVRVDGTLVHQSGAVPVSRVVSSKDVLASVLSDSMSTLFVWFDNRTPTGIYAQRLDTLANARWDSNGIPLCLVSLGGPKIVTDGNGGAILVGWRESDLTVRAQQVSRHGNLGHVMARVKGDTQFGPREQRMLYQNYPNPFNSATTIQYVVPSNGWVTIRLYNLIGQEIQIIVHSFHQRGAYTARVIADNLPSAVYVCTMQTQSATVVRKLIVLK